MGYLNERIGGIIQDLDYNTVWWPCEGTCCSDRELVDLQKNDIRNALIGTCCK